MEAGDGGGVTGGFLGHSPTPAEDFRGIVLFGRNVASYKFALAKSLIELAEAGRDRASLQELAVPFSRHLVAHIAQSPKQTTSNSSQFLQACQAFHEGRLDETGLIDQTVRLGFNNVIDAFHVVGDGDVGTRFFVDERKSPLNGIRLTDQLQVLTQTEGRSLLPEVEARWRLVEAAWDLGLDTSMIAMDEQQGVLLTRDRRRTLTSARDALNGYQKGVCFYCFAPIGISPGATELADVDHVIPHVLQRRGLVGGLDGVWNLVLSCRACNRGPGGKFHAIPDVAFLARLHKRNEFLISSHHPLRQTLINQTGTTTSDRRSFLQVVYRRAAEAHPARWTTQARGRPAF